MAEQYTYTPSNLPVPGGLIQSANVNTDLNGLINDFNLQVPLSKISADNAWTIWTTTYTGFSASPTQTLRYVKMGRMVTVEAAVTNATAASNSTSFSMVLPYAANVDIRWPIWAIDNTSNTIVGRAETTANSTTLTLWASISGTAWTASGNKGVSFSLTYESTT